MTSDADAFRAAILATPDDDAPRLVYADYLEIDLDLPELASFIRESIRCFRTPPDDADPDSKWRDFHVTLSGLGNEEFRLYGVGKSWYCENRDWVRGHVREMVRGREAWGWGWRRGFVEELCMPADDVVNELRKLRERFPIRRVVVTRGPSSATEVVLEGHVRTMNLSTSGDRYLIVTRNEIGTINDIGEHGDPIWQFQLKLLFRGVEFDFSSLPQRTTMHDERWRDRSWGSDPRHFEAVEDMGRRIAEEIERQTIEGPMASWPGWGRSQGVVGTS